MCNVAGAMFPGLIEDLDDEVIDKPASRSILKESYTARSTALKPCAPAAAAVSIINVSSGAIDLPYEGIGVYAMTKAAVAMFSQLRRTR